MIQFRFFLLVTNGEFGNKIVEPRFAIQKKNVEKKNVSHNFLQTLIFICIFFFIATKKTERLKKVRMKTTNQM